MSLSVFTANAITVYDNEGRSKKLRLDGPNGPERDSRIAYIDRINSRATLRSGWTGRCNKSAGRVWPNKVKFIKTVETEEERFGQKQKIYRDEVLDIADLSEVIFVIGGDHCFAQFTRDYSVQYTRKFLHKDEDNPNSIYWYKAKISSPKISSMLAEVERRRKEKEPDALPDPKKRKLKVVLDEDFTQIEEGLVPEGWICNSLTAVHENEKTNINYLHVGGDGTFTVPVQNATLPFRIEIWLENFLDTIQFGDVRSLVIQDHYGYAPFSLNGSPPVRYDNTDVQNDCFFGHLSLNGRCRIIDIYPTHVKLSAIGRSGKTYKLAIIRGRIQNLSSRLTIKLVTKYQTKRIYRLRLTRL